MIKVVAIGFVLIIGVAGFFISDQFFDPFSDGFDLPQMNNPKIVIKKRSRTLEVFDGDELIVKYNIALGSAPIGDKEIEGDGKTPEGEFYIFTKNSKSKFYLSLGISYPNDTDAARGFEDGLITQEEHDDIVKAIAGKRMPPQDTKLGGEIYIHGSGNLTDWTAGCVALKNKDMKQLFDSVPPKTPVIIER